MNKYHRKKRLSNWIFIKYKGDAALYVLCENCSYVTGCLIADTGNTFYIKKGTPTNYCPNCGKKMRIYNNGFVYSVADDGTLEEDFELNKRYE